MSNTLDKLQSIIVDHLGARAIAIDPDSPFQSIGLDDSDMEGLKIRIEENFRLSLSVIEEEHHEIDIDNPVHHLKELTVRQLAAWIDNWIKRDDIHPFTHGGYTR